MATKIRIDKINSLAELERLSWDYEPAGQYEVKCKCPVHDDHSPSVFLNTEKNLWKCHASSCQAQGDIISLLAYVAKCERNTTLADLMQRYDIKAAKTINPDMIEKYHERIWNAGPLKTALYERGVTDELIRKARLGYHEGRIMIPVYDSSHRVVNIRKYLPGAPGPEKMKNVKGYGKPALYQVNQTKYPIIWICGGEIKALVAGWHLNPHAI